VPKAVSVGGLLPRSLRIHYDNWDTNKSNTNKAQIVTDLSAMLNRGLRSNTALEIALHMKPKIIPAFLRRIAPILFALKGKGVSISVIRNFQEDPGAVVEAQKFMMDLTWLFAGDIDDFKRNIKCNGKTRTSLVRGSA
jgi:hypothetical protein